MNFSLEPKLAMGLQIFPCGLIIVGSLLQLLIFFMLPQQSSAHADWLGPQSCTIFSQQLVSPRHLPQRPLDLHTQSVDRQSLRKQNLFQNSPAISAQWKISLQCWTYQFYSISSSPYIFRRHQCIQIWLLLCHLIHVHRIIRKLLRQNERSLNFMRLSLELGWLNKLQGDYCCRQFRRPLSYFELFLFFLVSVEIVTSFFKLALGFGLWVYLFFAAFCGNFIRYFISLWRLSGPHNLYFGSKWRFFSQIQLYYQQLSLFYVGSCYQSMNSNLLGSKVGKMQSSFRLLKLESKAQWKDGNFAHFYLSQAQDSQFQTPSLLFALPFIEFLSINRKLF